MRLSQLKKILDEEIPRLQLLVNPTPQNPNTMAVLNAGQVARAARRLREVPALKQLTDAVLSVDWLQGESFHTLILPNPNIEPGRAYVAELQRTATLLSKMLSMTGEQPKPNELCVKLPRVDSIKELESVLRDLNLALDQPLKQTKGEGLDLASFDTGSEWLILSGAPAVFYFAVKLINLYFDVRKRQLELRQIEATVLKDEILVEAAGAFKDLTIKSLRATVDSRIEELIEAEGQENKEGRGEARNALMVGAEQMMKLLDRGLEVHLSPVADKAAQKLLPEPLTAESGKPKELTAHSEIAKGDAEPAVK